MGGFKLRVALLILYLWPVLFLCYVLTSSNSIAKRTIAVGAIDILLVLLFMCPQLISFFQKLNIRKDNAINSFSKSALFARIFIISITVLLIYYIACYPGLFSPDSIEQSQQALGKINYNDWHPALHTLLFFTLPLKLTSGWMGSIVLLQIIIQFLIIIIIYHIIIMLNTTTQNILSK